MRRGRRRRDERGAAAIEAALITPILFALLFGIVEMGFLMRDYVAAASATRVGARQATAVESREDAANCRAADTAALACAPRTVPLFVQVAATSMQQNGSAMPMEDVDGIAVYLANNDPDGPDLATQCTTRCVYFRWIPQPTAANPSAGEFRWVRGTWDAGTINRCPTTADRVGVKVFAQHTFLTGMFDPIPLEDYSVMTFEPLKVELCKPLR